MSKEIRRALVFGASGITGWAVLQEALQYPEPNTFESIIGLTNRPLSKSEAFLPDDRRLALYAGIDLSVGVKAVVERLEQVEGIEEVTHVFFLAYVQPEGASDTGGFAILKKANMEILENAVKACEVVCPQLKFWTLQTGGKAYGFAHALQIGLPKVPCKESDPRVAEPYADEIFYYSQHDLLKNISEGKRWTFAEVRPDAVVGFVPNNNAMNLAQAIGLFLAFYASKNGLGATVPFPGSESSYNALQTDVTQTTLARMHIYVSLYPEITSKQIFNIGDNPGSISWAIKWPVLCEYFGLKGTAPDSAFGKLSGTKYMRQHRDEWSAWEKQNGLKEKVLEAASWDFLEIMLERVVFNRQYDLCRLGEIGFEEQRDVLEGYKMVFERMKAAKMMP